MEFNLFSVKSVSMSKILGTEMMFSSSFINSVSMIGCKEATMQCFSCRGTFCTKLVSRISLFSMNVSLNFPMTNAKCWFQVFCSIWVCPNSALQLLNDQKSVTIWYLSFSLLLVRRGGIAVLHGCILLALFPSRAGFSLLYFAAKS